MVRLIGFLIPVLVIWCFPATARAAGTADLSIAVAGPSTVDQGTSARFTVTYANAGPDTATNLTVSTTIPSGLFVDLIDSSGFCTVAVGGQVVSCNVGTVGAGASGTLPIVISANTVGTYSIPFTITSDQVDPSPSDNAVTKTLEVVPPTHADLFIGFVNTNSTVRATETAVIQASYGNGGPLDATGVVITFPLAAGLQYQTAGSDTRCSASGQTVTCAIGNVAVGSLALLIIDVSAATAGSYPVTASIQGTQPDQNLANNVASFTLQVQPAVADLGVQFTGTTIRPLVGSPVQFGLNAVNTGPDNATGVTIQVAFPAGWTPDASVSDPRCTNVSSGVMSCAIGPLAASSGTSLIVAGIPPAAGTFTVRATINGDQLGGGTQASTQVTVFVPSADLSVAISGPSGPIKNKQSFAYTVAVRNSGPDSAKSVMLTNSLASQQEVDVQAISTTVGTCSRSKDSVTCSLGNMLSGATATVTIVLVATGSATVVDTSTVTSSTQDPGPANNTATISTTVK